MSGEEKILVVGAGPAGSACAWKLAREGKRVVLADKAAFPRPKLCGGALSEYGTRLLVDSGMLDSTEAEDLVTARHGVFSCFDSYRLLRTCSDCTPEMRIVDRTSFDSFLQRRAVESGAEFLEGQAFAGFEAGSTAVFSSGLKLGFERIVGADGASSTVRRRAFGRPRGRPGLCLQAKVPLAPAVMDRFNPLGLQVHFGLLPYGYGWVFPGREGVCVGVGSFGSRIPPRSAVKALEGLLRHLELGSGRPFRGALVPPVSSPVFPGAGRVLLAGDAAGLCDRVSGEGISHGVESGLLAAEAILCGQRAWSTGARCARQVRLSGYFRHLLYMKPFKALAMRKLETGTRYQHLYWGIAAGEAGYTSLIQRRRRSSLSAT